MMARRTPLLAVWPVLIRVVVRQSATRRITTRPLELLISAVGDPQGKRGL
jgi:hypothetical protein